MEQRFSFQNVRLEKDTGELKRTYAKVLEDVKLKGESLSSDFKDKFGAIKYK